MAGAAAGSRTADAPAAIALGAAIGLALVLAGCGNPGPSRAPGGSGGAGTIPSVDASALRYTCGWFPFGAEVLDVTRTDEDANTPQAAALRAHLAGPGPDIDFLPDRGWKLVGTDADRAEFVAVTDGDPAMVQVTLEPGAAGWKVADWGQCRPERVLADGFGNAEWWLPADRPEPGPDTRTFQAMVRERACASGRPADGRIVGPDVVGVNSLVLVTFAVRSQGGAQTCQANPASRVTVDLGEPLGGRTLLDGGTLPPRQPAEP